ncbi:MAG: FHA domain-containing protein [Acidobacteriota bacterium]|nr:MAG: FHA domain-containing protein [Acidobacteriota bacterium]
MTDLFFSYTDEDSKEQRVRVEGDRYIIGRHSQNDLSIVDSRLSRRHAKIERFADIFVVSDLQSSNGTKLNGKLLDEPATLSDGDVLDLGGVELKVELDGEGASPRAKPKGESSQPDSVEEANEEESPRAAPAAAAATSASSSGSGGSIFGNFFILAPLMVIGVIVILGFALLIYTLLAGGKEEKADITDAYPTPGEDVYVSGTDSTPESGPTNGGTDSLPTPSTGPTTAGSEIPTPEDAPAGDEKVRSLVTSFMRNIAQRDPAPVVTSEPLSRISSKIDQFRGSAAVGANIESALRSRTQIESIARSKNLKPEFVAAAALAKLGNSRGDVVATANGMIDALSGLKIQIGDAFANECVIIIAVYDQGERGEFLQMRDTMTKLATDNPSTSSRKVRTIWFLKEQGKLSDSQFDFALRFLAIGTIAKDPKAFGINAGPLNLA